MAIYRTVSQYFWTDSKVDDDFTPEDKYFYLYLLTNPHTNICGCYEISSRQMERETGYNADTIKRLLDRMTRTHNVIRYNSETKEVLILNWYKYNWSSSEKVNKAIKAVASHIKEPAFRLYVFQKADYILNKYEDTSNIDNSNIDNSIADNSKTKTDIDVSIPYGYGIDTISEEPKQKKKNRASAEVPADDKCPYKQIMELYHEICVSYPSIRGITGERQKAVKARWKDNPNLDTFKELFEKAESSSFMKGDNDRNWKADFDFMMNPNKFNNILEGKYSKGESKQEKPEEPKKSDLQLFMEQVEAKLKAERESKEGDTSAGS